MIAQDSRCPCMWSFNPLPSPKRGEIYDSTELTQAIRVSIRSPHRSEGRYHHRRQLSVKKRVSIRSPHRSEGRFISRGRKIRRRKGFNPLPSPKRGEMIAGIVRASKTLEFQSAPLTEARGDGPGGGPDSIAQGFNPLPSPKRGEMPWPRNPARSTDCFNPLPSPKRGEMPLAGYPDRGRPCFNPLPSPKRGEIEFTTDTGAKFNLFQSAPLTEARGDPLYPPADRLGGSFQSAPLTEARGDHPPTPLI